jgi:hypothetical protein
MNRAALILVIVAAAAPAACGGRSTAWTNPDFSDAAADAAAMRCDPYAQNCPAGSKCDFGCDGTTAAVACRADNGSGALGSACSASIPCAKGTGCLTSPDAGSTCLKYCAGDGDCATGQRCHNVDVTVNCGGPLTPLPLHVCY